MEEGSRQMMPCIIDGMQGIGDNIYQHPIVQRLVEIHQDVYLRTPWPQLYQDIADLKFLRPRTKLRVQSENVENWVGWAQEPDQKKRFYRKVKLTYLGAPAPYYRTMLHTAGLPPSSYFLSLRFNMITERRSIALIRPPTVRRDWRYPARNPKVQYIEWAIDYLKKQGMETFVIASIKNPDEIYDERRPEGADFYFEQGELSVLDMLDLCQVSRVVVGGVGFIVPMCIATGARGVIVHGGCGGLNHPRMIDAPGEGRCIHVLPKNYCICKKPIHDCDKDIDLWILQQSIDTALSETNRVIGPGTTESVFSHSTDAKSSMGTTTSPTIKDWPKPLKAIRSIRTASRQSIGG